jgi:hypothetical protein
MRVSLVRIRPRAPHQLLGIEVAVATLSLCLHACDNRSRIAADDRQEVESTAVVGAKSRRHPSCGLEPTKATVGCPLRTWLGSDSSAKT